MKKKLSKRIGCLMTALCLFALDCSAISAKELPIVITQQTQLDDLCTYDTDGDGLIYAIVIGSESDNSTSGGIRPMSYVGDNGVRLRSGPSTSSTVLELMYKDEIVVIDRTISNQYSGWYFLKRMKTGTWGYASSLYIQATG